MKTVSRCGRESWLLNALSSSILLIVVWLFLTVPWVCLQFLIVVFPDHTHLLFLGDREHKKTFFFCILVNLKTSQFISRNKGTGTPGRTSILSLSNLYCAWYAVCSKGRFLTFWLMHCMPVPISSIWPNSLILVNKSANYCMRPFFGVQRCLSANGVVQFI